VVGALDLDGTRRPARGGGNRAALLGRHDRVVRAIDDRRRDPYARELLGKRVAITKQAPHGQERIVDASHRREIHERRAEHEAAGLGLCGELGDHGGAEAFAEVQEPVTRQPDLVVEKSQRRADVARKAGLRRATAVTSVPPVVEEEDSKQANAPMNSTSPVAPLRSRPR
jgi:hypothetical protein